MMPKKIIIHCSVTPNGKRVEISEIDKWHKERGFKKVGYHMIIEPDGEVQRGRMLNEIGAHCEGENDDSIGICLIGNDKFTLNQFDSLRNQIDSLIMNYPIPRWAIYSHHQFPSAIKQGKSCPNIEINRLLAWYLVHDYHAIHAFILKNA